MPELQRRFVETLAAELAGVASFAFETAPEWLQRPGLGDFGRFRDLIETAYGELTGLRIPDAMPPWERRRVDAVITYQDGSHRILEFDERQHFTAARAITLRLYWGISVAFSVDEWLHRSIQLSGREPTGGFARPRPPMFPGEGGRHRQRAFRDLLADTIPLTHDWKPTARIHDRQALAILRHPTPGEQARRFWITLTGDLD